MNNLFLPGFILHNFSNLICDGLDVSIKGNVTEVINVQNPLRSTKNIACKEFTANWTQRSNKILKLRQTVIIQLSHWWKGHEFLNHQKGVSAFKIASPEELFGLFRGIRQFEFLLRID